MSKLFRETSLEYLKHYRYLEEGREGFLNECEEVLDNKEIFKQLKSKINWNWEHPWKNHQDYREYSVYGKYAKTIKGNKWWCSGVGVGFCCMEPSSQSGFITYVYFTKKGRTISNDIVASVERQIQEDFKDVMLTEKENDQYLIFYKIITVDSKKFNIAEIKKAINKLPAFFNRADALLARAVEGK